jgi:hypothetical protein
MPSLRSSDSPTVARASVARASVVSCHPSSSAAASHRFAATRLARTDLVGFPGRLDSRPGHQLGEAERLGGRVPSTAPR